MSFALQPWYDTTTRTTDPSEPRQLCSWEDAYVSPWTGKVQRNEVPTLDLTACRGSYVDWSEHNIRFRARHDAA